MKIKISGLSEGTHHLSFYGQSSELKLAEPFFDKYTLEIDLTKNHHQILMKAELGLKAKFLCDRCANEFESNVPVNFSMAFFMGIKPADTDDLNVQYLPTDADKIDITEEIFDYANLSIPLKNLCSEDCKGLCLKCGVDLNTCSCNCDVSSTDDRWLPLMELKNKLQ